MKSEVQEEPVVKKAKREQEEHKPHFPPLPGEDFEAEEALYDEQGRNQIAEFFLEKGNSFAEQGLFEQAISQWNSGLSVSSSSKKVTSKIHEALSQVYNEIGQYWLAVKEAELAVLDDPNWPECFITLARAQLNFGEPSMACINFQKALKTFGLKSSEVENELIFARQQVEKAKQRMESSISQQSSHLHLFREGSIPDPKLGSISQNQ